MRKAIFTVIFMVIITAVFISALAYVNEKTRDQIVQNQKILQYKSILYSFNIFPDGVQEQDLSKTATTSDIPWQEDQVLKKYNEKLETVKLSFPEDLRSLLKNSFLSWGDSVLIYVRLDENDDITAYGFRMKGKGLWGTITGVGAISADLRKMVGIDFTEQVETPGLGARILEKEFKYYFRNLDLTKLKDEQSAEPAFVMVGEKKQTNFEKSTNSFQAITGATQTCNGVLKMLETDLKFYLKLIEKNKDLIRAKLS